MLTPELSGLSFMSLCGHEASNRLAGPALHIENDSKVLSHRKTLLLVAIVNNRKRGKL